MTREEAKAYFTKLATDAGLPDEQRTALAAALENESVAKGVTDGFMLHADYSRSKNAVAEEKRKAEEDYRRQYAELQEWAKQHNQTIEQAKAVYDEYQRFKAAGLTVNGEVAPPNGKEPQPSGMTQDDIRKLLAEQAQQTGNLVKFSAKFNQDYYKRFGEFPDIDEFDSYLGEQRKANPALDVESAYQRWVAPKIEERREAQLKEQLAKAREEGARDALSKINVPVDGGKREMAPVWDPKRHELAKMNPEQMEENARNEFFAGWREATETVNSR